MFKRRLQLNLVWFLVWCLKATWRVRLHCTDETATSIVQKGEGSAVIACWHELTTLILPNVSILPNSMPMVSESRDGEALVELGKKFCKSVQFLRGSSSHGATKALLEGCRRLRKERVLVIITPDGPRGPHRQISPGASVLSILSGKPLLCLHCSVSRAWYLNSWDRHVIPKPFASLDFVVGESLMPPPSREDIDEFSLKIYEAMMRNIEHAEQIGRGAKH